MSENRRQLTRDISVFALLIAIGAVGRWIQPQWCFTPTAAVAVFAGFYFAQWRIAALVPLAVLGISDLLLPAYDSIAVMLATYAVMTAPVWLGRFLAKSPQGLDGAGRLALCGLVPATLFYLVSNFAVWAFQSDYPKTFAGLGQCYLAAIPFFRWMLAGDVFYLAVLFGCWALAGMPASAARQERIQNQ